MRAFVSGPTRANTVVCVDRRAERVVVESRRPASPVERAEHLEAEVVADLDRDLRALSPVMTFTTMPSRPRRSSDGRGVGLRPVDEHEEADEARGAARRRRSAIDSAGAARRRRPR